MNHTVDVDGADHAGIRWYEIRDPGGTPPTLYQAGTFAPDGDHRWMGSIAMDAAGNMALGYSVSSSTTYPSVRYVGRLAGDALGTLPQGETELIAGGGSQSDSSGRWGDYSMMAVDPVDDCTFWYTQEYYSTSSQRGWQTRIGSFRFPSCKPCASGTFSSTGTIALDQEQYTCDGMVRIEVIDCDLNLDPSVPDTVSVTIASGSEPGGESVVLTETAPDVGAFVGTIALDTADAPGVLQVSHGETVTATYEDADDGSGNPATVQDTAAVDCVAPVVANVATPSVGIWGATVTLDTDEPTTVVVRYGTACDSLTQSQASAGADTAHEVVLSGLAPSTTYFFAVEATDLAGNVVTDDNGGACYSFTTAAAPDDFFTELFDAADNDLDHQTLTFKPNGSVNFYSVCRTTAAAFPTDPTGGTVLSLGNEDYALVSLSGGARVWLYGMSYGSFYVGSNGYITFTAGDADYTESLSDHFRLPRISGLFDDLNFYTYSSVSWKQLVDRVAVTFDRMSRGSFQIELFFDGTIRLTHLAIAASGGLVGLSAGQGVPAGFVESDLSAYSCPAGTMSLDRDTYNCADSVVPAVFDSDLAGMGTVNVGLTTSGGDSETASLTEVLPGSGNFIGNISTEAAAVVIEDGMLQVGHGDTITATYEDADDGSGSPATVQDIAAVDCVAPVVASVATVDVGAAGATVTLETDEPATVVVRYGTACDSLTQSRAGVGADTVHEVVLSGLAPSTTYFFAVEATDLAGNVVADDNGGACYSFTTAAQPDFFTELFGASDNDLDHQTLTFTPDGSANFYSVCRIPTATYPTDPTGGTVLSLSANSYKLVTLSGGARVSLYGTRYSAFYVGSNGYITFTRGDTDYTESLSDHFRLPRISGLFDYLYPYTTTVVSWKQLADRVAVTFDRADGDNSFQIELFFDGTIRLTHLAIGHSDGLVGLSAGGGIPAGFVESDLNAYLCSGSISLDRDTYNCADSIGLTVFDGDLVGSGTLSVALATSGGDSETLSLTEAPAWSGTFTGSIPTGTGTAVNEDGVLQVAHGDTITATYEDAAGGSGNPATVQDSAAVDCGPVPVVEVDLVGGGNAGQPGASVCAPATLNARGNEVAATSNDIDFDPLLFSFEECLINPAIGPGSAADKQCEHGPVGPGVERVAVLGTANVNQIPDGVLYTARFRIDAAAPLGSYPLSNVASASDPAGHELPATGAPGEIVVTACTGDCNGDGEVTIGEVIRAVNLFLGQPLCNAEDRVLSCPVADANGDDTVTIGEVIQCVNRFLGGCA